jgi:hypothetical protein
MQMKLLPGKIHDVRIQVNNIETVENYEIDNALEKVPRHGKRGTAR